LRGDVRYANGVPSADSFNSRRGTPLVLNLLNGDLYCLLPWNVVHKINQSGSGGDWGDIGGTLADQTDLQAALDAKAASSHNHDGTYAAAGHNHDGVYSAAGHDHSGSYSALGHNHDAAYAALSHGHAISDVTGLQTALDGKSATSHDHDADYDAIGAAAAAYASASSDLAGHVAASDPHTGYQRESEKGQANGYASLGAGGLVPMAQLASGTPDGSKFVRDDGTLVTPTSGSGPTKISGNTGAFSGDTTVETLTSNSSDITTTTQTVVMTITGLGAGTYRVKGALIYQTAATTTGIGITLNHTVTVSRFVSNWIHITTGGAAATGISDQVTSTAAGQLVEGKAERVKDTRSSFTIGVDTANADELAIVDALIIVAVSGDLQLKIATEVAASAVRLMAGSTIEVNKVV
jgi:hypothetical protein